jgi:branched-chain amino acid transport system ATP-binding protein
LLKLSDIHVGYGDVKVIEDVSLEVREQEIVNIVGGNGAGKTTIMNTISGLMHPWVGTIEFQGQRIDGLAPYRIVEEGIAMVPEGRKLFPSLTVLENLRMGSFVNRARSHREKSMEMVFSLFPIIEERQQQTAGTLSGGEQQMLAIGRSLMSVPRLLMLDEPSLGLAPLVVREIFTTVTKINENGTTVLLVEQNLVQSLSLSHRGYVLENGRIVLQGTGKELLSNDETRRAYLGIKS